MKIIEWIGFNKVETSVIALLVCILLMVGVLVDRKQDVNVVCDPTSKILDANGDIRDIHTTDILPALLQNQLDLFKLIQGK